MLDEELLTLSARRGARSVMSEYSTALRLGERDVVDEVVPDLGDRRLDPVPPPLAAEPHRGQQRGVQGRHRLSELGPVRAHPVEVCRELSIHVPYLRAPGPHRGARRTFCATLEWTL